MARPRFEKLTAEKQERILMAAALEFAQKGFEAASFNQIIEAAEISKGAAYYYFDDKTDLYTTVIEHAFSQLAKFFGDYSMERVTAQTFWRELEDYSYKSLLRAQEYPSLTQLLRTVWSYAQKNPDAPGGHMIYAAARNWTETFLRRGQELGTIRTDLPMELLVELILGIGGATDTWVLSHVETMSTSEIAHYSKRLTNIHRRVCQPYEESDD